MKPNKETALHSAICSIILFIVLMVFIEDSPVQLLFLHIPNYIDFQVIKQIYLPIWAIAIIAILFRQYIFSYIFVSSAALGLIVEYIIHCHQQPEPTMKGAVVNTLIICLGFIIGVVVQIVVMRSRRRHSISKPP